MSGNAMHELLGEVFGTKVAAVQHTPEDLEKQAQLDFFSGLCKENGIDLTKLDEPQIEQLWKVAMEVRAENGGTTKAAEFPPPKGDDDKKKKEEEEKKANEKKAAATAEYNEKRAAAAKVAEADMMGRIMAHSYVDELRKIAADMEGGKPPFPPKKDEAEGKDSKEEEEKEKKAAAERASKLISALQQSKEASAQPAAASTSSTPNFDEAAAYHAIELLKTAGVEPELALARINAVYVLGLPDSTKIAAQATEDQARQVRALEFCEAAGFQVDWSKA